MILKEFSVAVPGSLPGAKLILYLQEYSDSLRIESRPLILICPGGGYAYTSDREAEPMALAFLAMGYHAAVLRYSCAPAKFPTSLLELAYSLALIRENSAKWHVKKDKIIVQGCSAGGHLAASLGCMWQEDFLWEALNKAAVSDRLQIRPDGLLLCYPVITSGEFAHRGSFENLAGGGPEPAVEGLLSEGAKKKLQDLQSFVSLEHRVTEQMPPVFLWHTFEDGSVPVENSLLFVSALRRAGISTEFHMYPRGGHGLALANRLTETRDGRCVQEECASWLQMAKVWLERI